MSVQDPTPDRKKTRFGRVPDFQRARNELDEHEVGELVKDIAGHKGDLYSEAQEVARAFHEDDSIKYNKNQLLVRDTAKELVDKHSQPDWAWKMLSVYSEDMGTRLLDVPSEGASKGLLVDENFETAFLYPKEEEEFSAVEHVRRWYDNGVNAQSIGYQLPAEDMERISLDISGEVTGLPVLAMNYNSEMVLDSKIDDYFSSKSEEDRPELQDREKWVEDNQEDRRQYLERQNVEDKEQWITGLDFLIENGYLENWGSIEYRKGKDNTAVDPETGRRMIVDLGEYRVSEGSSTEPSGNLSIDDSHHFSSGDMNGY